MSNEGQGFLDYGSGRYKLVGRSGCADYSLHNGDVLEVFLQGHWMRVQVWSDGQRWRFVDEYGQLVAFEPGGLPARLLS